MVAKLDITADLQCLVDDRIPVSVIGEGSKIQVKTASLRDLLKLSKHHTPDHQRRVDFVNKTHLFLNSGDLSASLLVAEREVALLSSSYEGGFIGRLLGLGPLQLRPIAIFLALFSKGSPPK